ncbi:MAG: hypothetical protein JWN55_3061, partial [Frankiales bacterium]|nr:hypothetical protein [Frankiales bacterium]
LLAGCGSTVPTGTVAGRAPGSALGTDSGLTVATGPGAAGGGAPTVGVPGPALVTDQGPALTPGAGVVGPTTSVGSSVSGAQAQRPGPGVTATSVAVGVMIADDTKAANSALGAGAVTHGDEEAEYRAAVEDLNRRGGAAGRKVTLVEFHFDMTTGASTDAIEQQACSYFTEDHRVAVVLNAPLTDVGLQCLSTRGVAVFGTSLSDSTDQTFARFPRYLEPLAMSLSRLVVNYADGMHALGFLPANAKVGLLSFDVPRFVRATAQLRQALARHGRTLHEVAAVKYAEQQSELGQQSADISSAVLRFRSSGITHVLFLDPSGVSELLFMNNAESQHYRPRYGFGQSMAAALRSTGVPAAQFVNSVTVGWFPRLDGVRGATYPPAEKACLELFTRRGISFDSDNARRHAGDICDSFSFFALAVSRVRGALNADTLVAAARSAPPLSTAGTYRVALTGGRTDGVDLVRYSAYVADCDCWQYRSGLQRAS